jgi:sugar/nucleoside kinase (ribokinase family)
LIFRNRCPEAISLGDTAVDLIASVPEHPRFGGDSEISVLERHAGGSAANFAVAMARLGISSGLISKVSSDEAGRFLRGGLKREGVDVTHLKQEDGGTGTIFVIVDRSGQRTMLSFRGVNVRLLPEEIPREYIAGSRLLHVSGYSLVRAPQCDAALTAMKYAKEANVRISFDPSPLVRLAGRKALAKTLGLVDVVLPSEAEAKYLSRKKNIKNAGRTILKKGPSIVAMKLGRKGCLVMDKNDELLVPAFNVETIDTTGAGDAYNAGFLAGHLKGWDLKRSAEFATAAAALKIMKVGARNGLPRIGELEAFMRHEHN